MGAEWFETEAKGKTAAQAFDSAVEQAYWDHGHAGYSGSICEKPGFILFELPGELPEELTIRDVARIAEQYRGDDSIEARSAWRYTYNHTAKKSERELIGTLPKSWSDWLAKVAEVADQKWAEAACLKTGDDTYLFFGYASC